MEKIPSFTIDHTRLLRGVYVSRLDALGSEFITTFDIRMKAPNREPVMDQGALHTLEHLAATFLRNHPVWGSRIVYWGPMGCQTGNYLLVSGKRTPSELLPVLCETFRFVSTYEGEVPGATPADCGNYKLHNLALAREEAHRYLTEVLECISPEQMEYPR